MAPMQREIAIAKLKALGAGAAIARKRYGKGVLTVGWGSGRPARRARKAKKK
jgi:hypothetical protein